MSTKSKTAGDVEDANLFCVRGRTKGKVETPKAAARYKMCACPIFCNTWFRRRTSVNRNDSTTAPTEQ